MSILDLFNSHSNTSSDNEVLPFEFHSTCHQRYENSTPVLGLQICGRTIRLEKNIKGCKGYLITPGDGYIVRLFNDDLGKPNMSDKPMRVVSRTSEKVELRGYPLEAMSPFGWVEVDYRDYGLSVYYQDGYVYKCILHMFDRNIDIEYRSTNAEISESKTATNTVEPQKCKPHFEVLAQQAMASLQNGNDGNDVYQPLFKAWREIQQNTDLLKEVQNKAILGSGLFVLISYGTVQDIDDRQQIISLAYLLLSDAINNYPTDLNLIRNRLLGMLHDKEAFQYTVSSATKPSSWFDYTDPLFQLGSWDTLYAMIYSDLVKSPTIRRIPILNNVFSEIEKMIDDGSFGQNKSRTSIIADGEKSHAKVLAFLHEKVYDNNDIDF